MIHRDRAVKPTEDKMLTFGLIFFATAIVTTFYFT